ncbi:MAG TPA: DUF3106 domain-containing protein [Leucothrix mucor]|nr:DUF3106 domain-containing protein [Leucothrix mucor]
MIKHTLPFLFSTSILFFSLQSFAIPWENLNPEEQKILKPYSKQWGQMSNDRQIKLRNVSSVWLKMDENEKRTLKKRLKKLKGMKSDQRQHVKHWFQWYQRQASKAKERINLRRNWFQSLSTGEQQAVKQQWKLVVSKKKAMQVTASK